MSKGKGAVAEADEAFGKLAMRKLSFLAFVGTISLIAGGCNQSPGGGETASSPSPTVSPAAQTPAANPSFEKPVVAGKEPQTTANAANKQPPTTPAPVAPPSDLIPSTDPKAQLNRVQRGGRDPFEQPPIQLENSTPETPTATQPQQPVPNVRRIPGTESTPGVTVPRNIPPRPLPAPQSVPTASGNRPSPPRPLAVQPPRGPSIPPSVTVGTPNRPQAPSPFALQPPGRRFSPRPLIALQPPNRPAAPSRFSLQPPRRTTPSRTVARAAQRPTPSRTVARTPQTTSRPRTAVAARPSTPNRPNVSQPSPATVNPTPPATVATAPTEPQIPALPPPPEPTLARAVEVSGVVQVGNEPQAIVKAPNEVTSRYVKVGQRLSNGQVLVKRIEMGEGSEPIVVLEENGVEVSKLVGERPAAPAQTPTPTAAIPAVPAVRAL